MTAFVQALLRAASICRLLAPVQPSPVQGTSPAEGRLKEGLLIRA